MRIKLRTRQAPSYNNTSVPGDYGLAETTAGPTGTWIGYSYYPQVGVYYNNPYEINTVYQPFNNTSLPSSLSTFTAGLLTTYTWSNDAFGQPTRPHTIYSAINGTESAFSSITYTGGSAPSPDGQMMVTASRTDSTSSSTTLTSITRYYSEAVTDSFFTSQPRSVVTPDGSQVSYAYQRGTFTGSTSGPGTFTASSDNTGACSCIAVVTGSSNSSEGPSFSSFAFFGTGFPIDPIYLVSGKSTLKVTLRDSTWR